MQTFEEYKKEQDALKLTETKTDVELFTDWVQKNNLTPIADGIEVIITGEPQKEEPFTEWIESKEYGLQYLNEEENAEVEKWAEEFAKEYGNDLSKLEEGFMGKLVGGVAGFLIGPTVGKIIANALGVEKGILYDMFTSRLVNTALGSAIGKYMTAQKIHAK